MSTRSTLGAGRMNVIDLHRESRPTATAARDFTRAPEDEDVPLLAAFLTHAALESGEDRSMPTPTARR